MKVCVLLPTYNEKENIGKMLDQLLGVSKSIKDELSVLVLDDNSPDGTAYVVKGYMRKHRNIFLAMGKKEGLGKAYVRGFNHVMAKMPKIEVVFMMDADLSHDPSRIPAFLRCISQGYDFVIGSRYVPGGKIPDWGFSRRIISFWGNYFARFVAGLQEVHDCTSGYRAIRVSTLRKIDFRSLYTRGYAFLSTLLFEAKHSGARFKEIPIIFHDRRYGKTKLNRKDIMEFFLNSLRLRKKLILMALGRRKVVDHY
jgi:dolichol-phosphate mannosyltransferase